jgi:hypothetical protein
MQRPTSEWLLKEIFGNPDITNIILPQDKEYLSFRATSKYMLKAVNHSCLGNKLQEANQLKLNSNKICEFIYNHPFTCGAAALGIVLSTTGVKPVLSAAIVGFGGSYVGALGGITVMLVLDAGIGMQCVYKHGITALPNYIFNEVFSSIVSRSLPFRMIGGVFGSWIGSSLGIGFSCGDGLGGLLGNFVMERCEDSIQTGLVSTLTAVSSAGFFAFNVINNGRIQSRLAKEQEIQTEIFKELQNKR